MTKEENSLEFEYTPFGFDVTRYVERYEKELEKRKEK